MTKNRPFEETLAEADDATNYLLTAERRTAIEAALFSDLDNPSSPERLERVCDALYWTSILKVPAGKPGRPSSQGVVNFMVAESRAGRTKKESREALSVMRKKLIETVTPETPISP